MNPLDFLRAILVIFVFMLEVAKVAISQDFVLGGRWQDSKATGIVIILLYVFIVHRVGVCEGVPGGFAAR